MMQTLILPGFNQCPLDVPCISAHFFESLEWNKIRAGSYFLHIIRYAKVVLSAKIFYYFSFQNTIRINNVFFHLKVFKLDESNLGLFINTVKNTLYDFVNVKITKTYAYDLEGEMV
jgi:hypothetical protein